MSLEEIKTTTREFVNETFLFDDSRTLADDESFLNSGILDSTGVLELITFLEDTYRVKFTDEELIADNFDTLERIAGFMERKLSPEASQ